MSLSGVRRGVVCLLLVVLLALTLLALAVVWTARDRIWFVDAAGVNATLDLMLTNTGRLVATLLLGWLALMCLLGLALELLPRGRRRDDASDPFGLSAIAGLAARPAASAPAAMPQSRQAGPPAAPPPATGAPPAYRSVVAGDEPTQRTERTVPAAPPAQAAAGDGRGQPPTGSSPAGGVEAGPPGGQVPEEPTRILRDGRPS